jgi:hypothetical protein
VLCGCAVCCSGRDVDGVVCGELTDVAVYFCPQVVVECYPRFVTVFMFLEGQGFAGKYFDDLDGACLVACECCHVSPRSGFYVCVHGLMSVSGLCCSGSRLLVW